MINMENVVIRNMKEEDSAEVLEMMKVFYASPALLSDPSEDVMKRDIADCLNIYVLNPHTITTTFSRIAVCNH